MMKKTICLVVMFLMVVALPALASDDWESWNGVTFKKKLNEKWSVSLFTQDRIRDDMSDVYYGLVWPTIAYQLSDHWSLGAGYMYARDQNALGKWDDENRYSLNTIWKSSLGDLKLYNRVQYEYRDVHTDPKPRVRNRFKISYPMTVFDQKVTPYIWEEPFYDIEDHRYNHNRAQAGVVFPLGESTSLDLYYMYIASKGRNDWSGRNVFGTQLTVNF